MKLNGFPKFSQLVSGPVTWTPICFLLVYFLLLYFSLTRDPPNSRLKPMSLRFSFFLPSPVSAACSDEIVHPLCCFAHGAGIFHQSDPSLFPWPQFLEKKKKTPQKNNNNKRCTLRSTFAESLRGSLKDPVLLRKKQSGICNSQSWEHMDTPVWHAWACESPCVNVCMCVHVYFPLQSAHKN